jgi:DNA-binding NtrC family response regulator
MLNPGRATCASFAPWPASRSGSWVTGVRAQTLRSYLLDVPPLPFTGRRQIIEEFERRYLEQVLANHSGNLSQAARAAGVSRRYLQMLKSKKPAT